MKKNNTEMGARVLKDGEGMFILTNRIIREVFADKMTFKQTPEKQE